jgi:hypothetical protein
MCGKTSKAVVLGGKMVKKRSNLKVATNQESEFKGRLRNSPSRLLERSATNTDQMPSSQVLGSQVFSSEEQALEVLLAQVVGRLEEDPTDQADMKAFLSDLLETDPVLREELLSEVAIRR